MKTLRSKKTRGFIRKLLTILIIAQALLSCQSSTSQTAQYTTEYICASCNWQTTCGSITPRDVVKYGFINRNPGQSGQSTTSYRCSNGSRKLGVLWSKKPCSETGGLEGPMLGVKFSAIKSRTECEIITRD